MKTTANLGLKKPEGTDIVNIDDLNGNMDTLDAEVVKKASSTADGRMTKEDKGKLDGIEAGANKYVHPATHPASILVQDANNRLVTDAEKTSWNAKETTTGAQTKVDNHANKTTAAHDASAIAVNDTDFTEKTVLAVLKSLKSLANNLKSKVAGAIGAPLSATDDASQMESKINTIKSTAATNLTAKGVAASASETLTALVNKISQIIRGSGNATTADVLATKTFTNDVGVQLTGTMPDYSAYPNNGGYVFALSTKGDSMTSLIMEPPTGYYKQGKNVNGYGALIASDTNYIPANIIKGKSIFGVVGTAEQSQITNELLKVVGTPRGLTALTSRMVNAPLGFDVNKGLFGFYDSSNSTAKVWQIGGDGNSYEFFSIPAGQYDNGAIQQLRGAKGHAYDTTWYCGSIAGNYLRKVQISYAAGDNRWNYTELGTVPNVKGYQIGNDDCQFYNDKFYTIIGGATSYTLSIYNTAGVLLNNYSGSYEYEIGGGSGTMTYAMCEGKFMISNQNTPLQTMIITANGVIQYHYKVTTNFYDRMFNRSDPPSMIKGLDGKKYLCMNAPSTVLFQPQSYGQYIYTGNLY
ncbi:hypothetical protein [Paenibacillus guangzhouensis]|uniref:hypothetical protein n=1 Tax=Paenibacillus guangzhouensis TaxID=1473112 RepID=UPI001266C13C|nr:hypothetical protein [Paenibacillus guangzhouensis]